MGGKRDEELACMLKVFYQERGGTNSRNGWGYIEKKVDEKSWRIPQESQSILLQTTSLTKKYFKVLLTRSDSKVVPSSPNLPRILYRDPPTPLWFSDLMNFSAVPSLS